MKRIRSTTLLPAASVLGGLGIAAAALYACSSAPPPRSDCVAWSDCPEADAASDAGAQGDVIAHGDGGGPSDAHAEGEAGCPSSKPDLCGSTCTNKQTDPNNCGTCGKICPGPDSGAGAATCTAGSCTMGCSGSTPDNCNGGCVNKSTDPNNCGSCGNTCPGPTTAGSGHAACVAGADGGPSCALACTAPTSQACGLDCVDPTSPLHCGSSCVACPGPTTGGSTGSAVCTLDADGGGTCSVQCSTTDSRQCPSGGGVACYAPNDLNNCGKCGNACQAPPSGQGQAVCQGSPLNCDVTCNGGFHKCVTGGAPDGDCLSDTDVPSQTSDPCIFSVPGAVFVSATTGSDTSGQGTAAAPWASIGHALAHLGSTARVYVCNGTYNEQVSITASVSIFGGLSCTAGTWSYVGSHASVTGPANQPALTIAAGSSAVDIEDMAFTAPNASGTDASGNGNSSIAALVNASTNVTFKRCALSAGNGASAAASPAGTSSNYSGATAPAGSANTAGSGGAGGTASCGYGSSKGGAGGTVGVSAGAGGSGSSTPAASLGTPGVYDGAGGAAKQVGDDGASGAGQTGGSAATSFGSLSASGWTPSAGGPGQPGNPGQGGGGGGVPTTPAPWGERAGARADAEAVEDSQAQAEAPALP